MLRSLALRAVRPRSAALLRPLAARLSATAQPTVWWPDVGVGGSVHPRVVLQPPALDGYNEMPRVYDTPAERPQGTVVGSIIGACALRAAAARPRRRRAPAPLARRRR